MTGKLLILFGMLTALSLYSSYSGLGLEEVKQGNSGFHYSTRISSSHSYSNGGWSYGK